MRLLVRHRIRRSKHKCSVFRELLQNSDDASSREVEIRFETKRYIDRNNACEDQAQPLPGESLPDLKTTLVRGFPPSSSLIDLISLAQVQRWTFKNNGIIFRDEDWNRLKKIGTRNLNVGWLYS